MKELPFDTNDDEISTDARFAALRQAPQGPRHAISYISQSYRSTSYMVLFLTIVYICYSYI